MRKKALYTTLMCLLFAVSSFAQVTVSYPGVERNELGQRSFAIVDFSHEFADFNTPNAATAWDAYGANGYGGGIPSGATVCAWIPVSGFKKAAVQIIGRSTDVIKHGYMTPRQAALTTLGSATPVVSYNFYGANTLNEPYLTDVNSTVFYATSGVVVSSTMWSSGEIHDITLPVYDKTLQEIRYWEGTVPGKGTTLKSLTGAVGTSDYVASPTVLGASADNRISNVTEIGPYPQIETVYKYGIYEIDLSDVRWLRVAAESVDYATRRIYFHFSE